MKHQNRLAAAALSSVVTVVLAGCGGSAATGTGGGASGQLANTSSVFTFGQTTGITQLDPNISAQLAEDVYFSLLYDGLTERDANGKAKPDLATSWSSSNNGLTWTFKLRSGVKYASGAPFTASDAVANIDRVLNPKLTSQFRTNISMISNAVATNPTTLTLTLKTPNALLPASLSYVKMTNVKDIASINKNADGTGPYKLKSFIPSQTLDLVPNPNYWGPKPKLGEIDIVTYPDETAAETALRNGTLTALWDPAATAIGALATDGRKVIQSTNPGGVDVLELDTTSPPFSNPKARQALAYAVDRASIIKAAYSGHAIVNPYQTFVSPKDSFFDSSLTNYSYNLSKAKQLFAEAGIKSGTTLTYWTIAGAYPEMAVWGQIMQQDLAQIGIKLQIEAKETSTWLTKFYPDGKSYPGLIVSNKLSFNPPPDVFAPQWFSSTGTCECNWKGAAPGYDQALSALQSATTTAGQQSAFETIEKDLNAASPVVVIDNSSPVAVVQGDVHGAWEDPDGVLHLETASMG
jgi:peptide/nickel transport system substrate-binding protein